MKKVFLLLLLSLAVSVVSVSGQIQRTEVLTLGTFHFNFPNLDVFKIDESDQIDVLNPRHQAEIEEIVDRLAKFRPTIIAIELSPQYQSATDSLYSNYLESRHQLSRNETQQIGFRLGKNLGLQKIYCVDEWGRHYDYIQNLFDNQESQEFKDFANFFYDNPDTSLLFRPEPIFKTESILAELIRGNDKDNIKKNFGTYLIGPFKYSSDDNEFFGADFRTGQWFNRNLRIYRNIQKINAEPTDRILVIIGFDHLNLLNYFFECSPEFDLVDTNYYLKD